MPNEYAQACHNMRLYLKEAMLLPMPLSRACPRVSDDERSPEHLFLLSPQPDSRRKLRTILYLLPRVLDTRIKTFIHKHVPNKPVVGAEDCSYERFATIRIPAKSFDIIYKLPGNMQDILSMASWMDMPLLTAERVMHIVWPEQNKGFCLMTKRFIPRVVVPDVDLCKLYYWRKVRGVDQNDIQESTYKLIIVSLVPWALSPVDLDDFMRISQFPGFKLDPETGLPVKYTRTDKIWAKLWDECTSKNCPYFVLSVYHGWIFGVFVKGWSVALISDAIIHTDESPTVLQWLVYWLAASMGLPDAWAPPPLKRFRNPDISDVSNVADKISFQGPEHDEVVSQAEWLEKNHKQDRDKASGNAREYPGLVGTWFTDFNDE